MPGQPGARSSKVAGDADERKHRSKDVDTAGTIGNYLSRSDRSKCFLDPTLNSASRHRGKSDSICPLSPWCAAMTETTPEDAGLTPSDLFKNPSLRKYLSNVRDWHGYVRFLGLPGPPRQPGCSHRPPVRRASSDAAVMSCPDEDPSQWLDEAETVFDALSVRRPLVLLGDPGTGKSTLLQLCCVVARTSSGRNLV